MKQIDITHYFAYGSNMSHARLQARVPSAKPICNAYLPGHALRFHKKGADGSAKCDVVATGCETDRVHGVVFEFHLPEKPMLDFYEGPKYQEALVELVSESQALLQAYLYVVADKQAYTDRHLKPYHWYKHHVVYGARQAGLPADYVANLLAVESVLDENHERTQQELSIYSVLEHHDLPFTV